MKKRNRNIVQVDSPDGQRAGEAVIETVENKIGITIHLKSG